MPNIIITPPPVAAGNPAPAMSLTLTRDGAAVALSLVTSDILDAVSGNVIGGHWFVEETAQAQTLGALWTLTNSEGTVTRAADPLVIPAAVAPTPTVTAPLPDQNLTLGAAAVVIDLSTRFANAATYAVSPTGAGVTISGSTMTISTATARDATYTVTATNSTGQSVTDAFALVVAAAAFVGNIFDMNEGSGATITDRSGDLSYQLVNGVTWQTDPVGLDFDGLTLNLRAYATVTNAQIAQNMLFGVVVKADQLNGTRAIMSIYEENARIMQLRTSGAIPQAIAYLNSAATTASSASVTLVTNQFYLLTGFITDTSVAVRLNGANIASATFTARNKVLNAARPYMVLGSRGDLFNPGLYIELWDGDMVAHGIRFGAADGDIAAFEQALWNAAAADGVTLPALQ